MNRKNLQNKKLSGFTLIELLVVITIIGILASIVVVNLNSARGKGQDTAIKEQMSQMRAQASLYYDDNYGYSSATSTVQSAINGACTSGTNNIFGNADIKRAIDALKRNSGSAVECYLTERTTSAPSQDWAVITNLKTMPGRAWCVDAVGNAIDVADDYTPTNARCQ